MNEKVVSEKVVSENVNFVPPKKSLTVEFWVGVFCLLGLLCFGYLAISIASIRITDAGYYEVKAEFDSIAGLKSGAPVEIAGVEIGEVKSFILQSTSAVVTLRIRDDVKLRDDDIAAIRTKGIIGDRYLKIIPGGSENQLKNGGKIGDTESAVEFEEILGKLIHKFES